MNALSYNKVDTQAQNKQKTRASGITRFLKATALAISTLLPFNAHALVEKEEQRPAISLDGSLRVWNSVWRSYKYYYAKKGRKWNSAGRVAHGIASYYGIYGMKSASVDVDGCVSCSEPVVSPRKLTEQETERLGLELVGVEMVHNNPLVHNLTKDERLVLFLTHGKQEKHEIEATLALLEHGFSHQYISATHVGNEHSAVGNEHGIEHEFEGYHTEHHAFHFFSSDHDSLTHIGSSFGQAFPKSLDGHNPFWMIHMYALHVGHEHSAVDHDGEHEPETHHSGHHGNHHGYHAEDHDPLAHIAHMGSGHGHNPFWMIHMYALHVGHGHSAVSHENVEQHNVGPGNHTEQADTHNIPIGLIFDLKRVKRAPLVVADALPPLE